MRVFGLVSLIVTGAVFLGGPAGFGGAAALAADKPDNDTCLACHGNEGFSALGAGGKQRPLHIAPDTFGKSAHAKLQCVDCHATITEIPHKGIPAEGSPARAEARKNGPGMCGTCHAKQFDEYAKSVHGKEVLEKGNPAAAVCSSCHSPHSAQDPTTDPARLAITQKCGTCHEDRLKTYRETYMTDIAATVAAMLQIQMPNGCVGHVIPEVIK